MKYRLLTSEELHALEGDLKAFLIINGIEGETWKALNENEAEKAQALVELFSDQVLQTVYEKVNCLEMRTPETWMVIRMEKENQHLRALRRKEGSQIDLSNETYLSELGEKLLDEVDVFTGTKSYSNERELEVHGLVQQGFVAVDETVWNWMNFGQ